MGKFIKAAERKGRGGFSGGFRVRKSLECGSPVVLGIHKKHIKLKLLSLSLFLIFHWKDLEDY